MDKLRNLLLVNQSFSRRVKEIVDDYLQEEERKLAQVAERALLDSELHHSAVMQLGRVQLLRDVSIRLTLILGEQNDG